MSDTKERSYSVKDLIYILQVPKVTILSWIHKDQLAAILMDTKDGGRSKYIVNESDLMDFLYNYKKRLPKSARVDEAIFRFIIYRISDSVDLMHRVIGRSKSVDIKNDSLLLDELDTIQNVQYLLEDILQHDTKRVSKSSDENRAW